MKGSFYWNLYESELHWDLFIWQQNPETDASDLQNADIRDWLNIDNFFVDLFEGS